MLTLYIRKESVSTEQRTPLVPNDVYRLINNNIHVIVESCTKRVYSDEEYKCAGATITEKPWYSDEFKTALIVGIKELNNLEKLNKHTHIYFSHSFKNQLNSDEVLTAFMESHSVLYDFEYFVDSYNKRQIAFGYYAGIVGAVLGLKQFTKKFIAESEIINKATTNSLDTLLINFKQIYSREARIVVIGANGRCGSGVLDIFTRYKIPFTIFTKMDQTKDLINFDLLFNCIKLDESYDQIWFTKTTVFTKPLLIVDISCDYSKPNNPIAIYSKPTTLDEPVYRYNEYVDIIAIDNLPSILPKESSDGFSSKFTELLLVYGSDIWKRCLDKYESVVFEKMERKIEKTTKN